LTSTIHYVGFYPIIISIYSYSTWFSWFRSCLSSLLSIILDCPGVKNLWLKLGLNSLLSIIYPGLIFCLRWRFNRGWRSSGTLTSLVTTLRVTPREVLGVVTTLGRCQRLDLLIKVISVLCCYHSDASSIWMVNVDTDILWCWKIPSPFCGRNFSSNFYFGISEKTMPK
jgi:hypothetical protein